MLSKLLCIFLVTILCNCTNVEAFYKAREVFRYYYVDPKSKADLFRQIKKKSPVRINGVIYSGKVDWRIKWRFKEKFKYGKCWVEDVKVDLVTVYSLPDLLYPNHTPEKIKVQFQQFFEALWEHEKGHHKIAVKAMKEIDYQLRVFPANRSCKKLIASVNKTGRKIISKFNALDREYDKQTNHGETQGVVMR